MTSDNTAPAEQVLPEHGAELLPAVRLDSYNLEIKDEDGFIGDAASTRAFREVLDEWRDLFPGKEDPLGGGPSEEIGKRFGMSGAAVHKQIERGLLECLRHMDAVQRRQKP